MIKMHSSEKLHFLLASQVDLVISRSVISHKRAAVTYKKLYYGTSIKIVERCTHTIYAVQFLANTRAISCMSYWQSCNDLIATYN